jgi:hypothetical protein
MNQNSLEKQKEIRQEIIESFRLMWDCFPHPVLLLHKSRTIVDANQAARNLGVAAGIKCRDISPSPENCRKHCQADKVLASKVSERIVSRQGNKLTATYWLSLNVPDDDLYLHFSMEFPDTMIHEEVKAS